MIFKLAVKQLFKNKLSNIIIIFQLFVILILTLTMVSTILSRGKYFFPFKDMLDKPGVICSFTGNAESEVNKNLQEVDSSIFTYMTFFDYDNIQFQVYSYKEAYLDKVKPTISDGIWLTESQDDKYIHAVITENEYGIKTGDFISYEDKKIKVIGVAADNTYLYGYTSGENGDINQDFRDLFRVYNHNYEIAEMNGSVPKVLMSYEDAKKLGLETVVYGHCIISFNEDISDKMIKQNKQAILGMHGSIYADNSTALKNSEKLVYNQVYLLLPIIICVFLITAISVISVNAITVRRQLKNYAIYNICGLSWKKCCLINLLSSIIMCLIAIIMMVISVVLTKYISFFSQTVIDFGIIQVLSCVFLIVVYLILAMIMPIIVMKNNTSKEILTSNE